MIAVIRVLGWIVVLLVVCVSAVLLLGPRESVDRDITFDPSILPDDLDQWLAEAEAGVPNIRDGAEKRILWAGETGEVTPLSVVYVHGFSASADEIRPVPDNVAGALGANLFFTRLSGHGRDGAAMAEPGAGDWIEDMAEAMAIGRRIGERVMVMATSTGGTLAALAATDPDLSDQLAGVVLISPNFGVQNSAASLLTLPWARHWVPKITGPERGFEPRNEAHAQAWTSRYPVEAAVPLMVLVEHAGTLDYAGTEIPALFLYSEQDKTVNPEDTRKVHDAWGGAKARELMVMGPEDDPGSHVIAGDILSPGQTQKASDVIVDWATGL